MHIGNGWTRRELDDTVLEVRERGREMSRKTLNGGVSMTNFASRVRKDLLVAAGASALTPRKD